MNKISIITAIASAYAAVAATSFMLGFLLAPAKAQAEEGEIVVHEVPPYSLSHQRQPDRVSAGMNDRNMRMRLQALTGWARIGSVQAPAAKPFDPQSNNNIFVNYGAID